MKKVLLLLLLMFACLTSHAQENPRIIDRNVTFSGPLFVLCKSKIVTNETAINYGEATFFIKNDRVGESNFISFWIEIDNGHKREYNSWKDNDVHIEMLKTKDGNNAFSIIDDTFNYLTAVEMKDGRYGIQLFTTLKE